MASASSSKVSPAPVIIALAAGVEQDLRNLTAEGKRKHPDLQSSAERAIQKLRAIAGSSDPGTEGIDTLQSDLILRPLLLVSALKQPKLTTISLGAIQRLLSLSPLNARFVSSVIGALRIQAETDDDKVQIKILQTLLQMIGPASIECGELLGGSLLQAMGICFRLFALKNPMIHNTAFAAVRQIIMMLFDRAQAQSLAKTPEQQAAATTLIAAERAKPPTTTTTPSTPSTPSTSSSSSSTDATLDVSLLANLSTESQNAVHLFHDLCLLAAAADDKPAAKWLTLSSPIPPAVCIELLESLLRQNKDLFLAEPAFFVLLKQRFCPAVVRLFRSLATPPAALDFPIALRLVRCVQVLTKFFLPHLNDECETVLIETARLMAPERAQWQHVLALEVLITFTNNPQLLYEIFARFDKGPRDSKVLANFVHILGQFVSQSNVELVLANGNGVNWKLPSGRCKGLDLLHDMEPPHYEDLYKLSISIEAIMHIVNSFAALVAMCESQEVQQQQQHQQQQEQQSSSSASEYAPSASTDPAVITRPTIRAMVTATWMPILAALSFLLAKTNDEERNQYLLMSYQSFTNTSGMLGLAKPRDALLQSLCSFALKRSFNPELTMSDIIKDLLNPMPDGSPAVLITPKNIQSLKALFNIAHCLGSLLTNAWSIVLDTFHQLDTVIQVSLEIQSRMKRESGPVVEQYARIAPNQADISIMSLALSRLFESTRYLDEAGVSQVLSALGALSLTTLAATQDQTSIGSTPPATPTSRDLNPSGTNAIRIFSLANLIATIEHNMFRISSAKLWELGVSHLSCVLSHRDARMRAYGVEALRKLTVLALGKRPDPPASYTRSAATPRASPHASGQKDSQLAASELSARHSRNLTDEQSSVYDDPENFQLALLRPLHELFVKSRFDDTKQQLLQALHSVLQSSGQSLANGWTVVLEFLGQAVQDPDGLDVATAAKLREMALREDSGASSSQASQTLGGREAKVPSAAIIALGFTSVQLIVNDFIDSIPYDQIDLLVATIGFYCSQRQDANVSFTGIGLLWRVSDFIGRVVGVPVQKHGSQLAATAAAAAAATSTDASESASTYTSDDTTSSSNETNSTNSDNSNGNSTSNSSNGTNTNGNTVCLTEAMADQLMLAVFKQLHVLSSDLRTEVRNSAVKTFASTLVAHGGRIRASTCLVCLKELMLPLMNSLMEDTQEKDSQGASKTQLGRDKDSGRAVMMMVHHSRDTAAKQWDETRVYAVQGSARVMKVFVESWYSLEPFVELWPTYLAIMQRAVCGRSTEVSLAAITSLQEIFVLPSLHSSFVEQPKLWTPVVPAYCAIVDEALRQAEFLTYLKDQETAKAGAGAGAAGAGAAGANANAKAAASSPMDAASLPESVPRTSLLGLSNDSGWKHWMKTYTQLVVSFQTIHSASRRLFLEADFTALLACVQKLARVDASHTLPKIKRAIELTETALQGAVLKFLESLNPIPEAQWPMMIDHLLGYVISKSDSPAAAAHSGSSFARKCLALLNTLYAQSSPTVRAQQFGSILAAMDHIVQRQVATGAFHEDVMASLLRIVETGLAIVCETNLATPAVWTSLVSIFSSFLSPHRSGADAVASSSASSAVSLDASSTLFTPPTTPNLLTPRATPQEQQIWEHMQIAIVGLLVRNVLPSARSCPVELQWQLVLLLNIGFEVPSADPSKAANGDAGAAGGMATYEMLAHAALMSLFALAQAATHAPATAHSSHVQLSLMALPLLVQRCQSIISSYAAAERQRTTRSPALPRSRREEIGFVLQELSNLNVQPLIARILTERDRAEYAKTVTPEAIASAASLSSSSSSKRHLIALFPVLCDAVVIHELELRETLRELLIQSGREMMSMSSSSSS